jgi:hypothetical protein
MVGKYNAYECAELSHIVLKNEFWVKIAAGSNICFVFLQILTLHNLATILMLAY